MFALLIHIYYHDSWKNIFREQLKALENFSPIIMINLCMDFTGNNPVIDVIKNDFPTAFVITTPNKGKDIGGKLALISMFMLTEQKADYIIFLHDKISPHSITGDRWREKLFSIISPGKIKDILNEFETNSVTGIIGARDFIKNEFDEKNKVWETTNNAKLEELTSMYHLTVTSHTFVAGTMFWIRSAIVENFFSVYPALDCRELLEEGDPTDQHVGTYTHSWERILCWLANDQHYTLKGI